MRQRSSVVLIHEHRSPVSVTRPSSRRAAVHIDNSKTSSVAPQLLDPIMLPALNVLAIEIETSCRHWQLLPPSCCEPAHIDERASTVGQGQQPFPD
ncbi:hypothetical protein DESC_240062 [Desulfosarcina cetonica]|nr:hypothetical protein DESC_240062 [Desulfosarcina cetonica]